MWLMMKYQDKIKEYSSARIWKEYCGFLDLGIDQYMQIQNSLMREQLHLWMNSGLGKKMLPKECPESIDIFRESFPLTSYSDYADDLLAKRTDLLPGEPIVWIQTTWEGGIKPIKLAPYTRSMLDTYKHNSVSVILLTSAEKKGEVNFKRHERFLYGGAPLPYATGLLPSLLAEEIDVTWLPDGDANNLSFSQRIKKGFSMALRGGIDYIFATGSVANYMTEAFGRSSGGSSGSARPSLKYALRWLKAKYISKRDGRNILPKDIFDIKGFVCAGTDAKAYRERLENAWGVYPIEIAAGTESTCIATETRLAPGMVFFPDACFYEFIPEDEMLRNLRDPAYKPVTCLMNEVKEGESYELVISVFHGGAFMRYRIGDVYRCISGSIGGALPRFTFVDRVPNVIDIAGFTRITEASVNEVIKISGLAISDWIARKEFDDSNNPYFHMFIEISPDAQLRCDTTKKVLAEHLATYFKAFDSDYGDLKKLLGMEPLRVTVLSHGTIKQYKDISGRELPRINAHKADISALLRSAFEECEVL